MHCIARDPSNQHISTLIDFYGFPFCNPVADVKQGQQWLAQEVNLAEPRFIPFFVKFEFESWLLAGPESLVEHLLGVARTEKVREIRSWLRNGGPEEVNGGQGSHPKQRLKSLFEGKYKEVLHGTPILQAIGLKVIRQSCPHFDGWLTKLESLVTLKDG